MDAKQNGRMAAQPRPKWWPTDGDPDADGFPQGGLTKRELLAAMAMQGAVAHHEYSPLVAARHAIAYADALLAELAKEA
jgi:hypothetical protein